MTASTSRSSVLTIGSTHSFLGDPPARTATAYSLWTSSSQDGALIRTAVARRSGSSFRSPTCRRLALFEPVPVSKKRAVLDARWALRRGRGPGGPDLLGTALRVSRADRLTRGLVV